MLNYIYTELSDITDKQDVYIFPESTAPQDHGTFVHILVFVSVAIPVPRNILKGTLNTKRKTDTHH